MSEESQDEKKIVIPGEVLKDKKLRPGEKVIKTVGGLTVTTYGILAVERNKATVIPYKEIYRPRKDDIVIGAVVGYGNSGWFVDIGSYTKAFLHVSEAINEKFDSRHDELSNYLKIGDIILAKVTDVARLGYFQITIKDKGLGKIGDAFFIKVNPVKLRRIIGRKGSMINLIKKNINGDIILAKNGVIVFKGDYDSYIKLKKTIKLISEKTFASGLTSKVSEILSNDNTNIDE